MESEIYTDSVSAWKGLIDIGGLELDGRDEDLEYQLKAHIDPNATDLNVALASVPIDIFLQALFQVIQPFISMYGDILDFFTKARAREGKVQWRLSVDQEIINLRNFEEFLEQWNNIRCQIEVPAIDSRSAWILLDVLRTSNSYDIIENIFTEGSLHTGFIDVDSWLTEYENDRYTQLPSSLHPNNLYHGLDDAASVVIGALQVLKAQRLDTRQSLYRYRTRCQESIEHDAFHPCSIAQNETDYWLRTYVLILAHLLRSADDIKRAFDQALAQSYRRYS